MKRILYIDGYGSQDNRKNMKDDWNYPVLTRLFAGIAPVDYLDVQSDPSIDIKLIQGTDWSKYDLVIGFSMGGLYTCAYSPIKSVVINPAYGLSQRDNKFTLVEMVRNKNKEIYAFFGKKDKYSFLKTNYISIYGTSNIIGEYDGKHAPTEDNWRNEIFPKIKELLGII